MSTDLNRRRWLKLSSIALVSLPFAYFPRHAQAITNDSLRVQFNYQDTPRGGMNCANCLEFIPGKSTTDLGGCKQIPKDDEISPNGYCSLWNSM
jgi:hypothetical protein